VVDRVQDEKAEGSGFSSGCVLEVKIKTMSLTEALGADAGLELDHLVVGSKLFAVGPGGRDWAVM
jgi:hypothetical protein